MNGSWGITGHNPGCGRRQLNSRLFAGQFTNMRNVSVFGFGGPRVVVNNYADTGFYNDGMSMPKWMQWTMLGGMGMSFLGNIFSAIFGGGGGGKTEGAGSKETKGLTSEQKADLDVYMKLDKVKDKYKSYSPLSDGSFILQHKDGTAEKVGSYDELKAKLEECLSASETPEPGKTEPGKTGNKTELDKAQAKLKDEGITDITAKLDDNGDVVYEYNGKTYNIKTDKNGYATLKLNTKVKVKKSMLKKLKVAKKYKYKVTYGKDIVTKKLTIKK